MAWPFPRPPPGPASTRAPAPRAGSAVSSASRRRPRGPRRPARAAVGRPGGLRRRPAPPSPRSRPRRGPGCRPRRSGPVLALASSDGADWGRSPWSTVCAHRRPDSSSPGRVEPAAPGRLPWWGSSRAAEGRARRRRGNQCVAGRTGRAPGANARPMRRTRWSIVTGLRCRECGRAVPRRGAARLRLLLRAARGGLRLRAHRRPVSRERIAAGPRTIWRYRDLLPVDDDAPVDLGAGFTPLVRADRLAAELGLGELWIKDDTANPTGSFKDRVVSVALTKARQLGFKVAACASTGNLANSVAAHAARAGMASVVLIPHDLEEAKVTMTAVYGGTVVVGRGHLRRRQPAVRRADQRAPQLGLRQRQRAHLLRRGLQDPGLRGGRAAGLGGPRPRRGAHRLGQPADQGGQGLRRAGQGRPAARGARRCGSRAPRRPAARRWPPPSPRGPTPSGRSSPRPSPSRCRSATRPTAGTRSRPCADRAGPARR